MYCNFKSPTTAGHSTPESYPGVRWTTKKAKTSASLRDYITSLSPWVPEAAQWWQKTVKLWWGEGGCTLTHSSGHLESS